MCYIFILWLNQLAARLFFALLCFFPFCSVFYVPFFFFQTKERRHAEAVSAALERRRIAKRKATALVEKRRVAAINITLNEKRQAKLKVRCAPPTLRADESLFALLCSTAGLVACSCLVLLPLFALAALSPFALSYLHCSLVCLMLLLLLVLLPLALVFLLFLLVLVFCIHSYEHPDAPPFLCRTDFVCLYFFSLPVFLSVCLSIRPSVLPPVCLSVRLFAFLYVSVSLSRCLVVSRPICLPLSVRLFDVLRTCLSILSHIFATLDPRPSPPQPPSRLPLCSSAGKLRGRLQGVRPHLLREGRAQGNGGRRGGASTGMLLKLIFQASASLLPNSRDP